MKYSYQDGDGKNAKRLARDIVSEARKTRKGYGSDELVPVHLSQDECALIAALLKFFALWRK